MPSAARVKPFPFDRVFAAPAPAAKQARKTQDPQVAALEHDIEALKREHEAAVAIASAESFQRGLDQARTERDASLLAATDALQAEIERIDARFAAVEGELAREAGELAREAAEYIAARALEREPLIPIDAALGRALEQVVRGTPLLVEAHPDIVAALEEKVAERQSHDRRRLSITVRPNPDLGPGDAVIAWDEGGLRLDAQLRREAVHAELDGLFGD